MTERTRTARTPTAKNAPANGTALYRPDFGANFSPVVRNGITSGGQFLDKHTQREMSARFGHDFSKVRIHTDARAEASAEAMDANAFAIGRDIVFGGGKYNPGSRETERLLAHELTHIVQQAQGGPGLDLVSRLGDASEREADTLSSQAMAGEDVSVQATPTAVLSRSFLDGEDPENDFWGTKSNLGKRWGGTADAGMSTFWDAAGLIPGLGGKVMGGVSTGIDLLKAGGSEAMSGFYGLDAGAERYFGTGSGTQSGAASDRYSHAAGRFMHDAEFDALGMIPGIGTGVGGGTALNDAAVTIDRAAGHDPDNKDTLGSDVWDKGMSAIGL